MFTVSEPPRPSGLIITIWAEIVRGHDQVSQLDQKRSISMSGDKLNKPMVEKCALQLAVAGQRMDVLRRKLLAEGWNETTPGILERRDILGVRETINE